MMILLLLFLDTHTPDSSIARHNLVKVWNCEAMETNCRVCLQAAAHVLWQDGSYSLSHTHSAFAPAIAADLRSKELQSLLDA